jgi:hypothetical protein
MNDIQTHTNTKTHKCLCVSCTLPIEDEEEQKWAEDPANHPGVLGPLHQKCYDKACAEKPDLPWTDPISGEVDFEAMEEDLGVSTIEEEEEYY